MNSTLKIFSVILLSAVLYAQPKSLRITRTDVPLVIDGYGNDTVWTQAETGSDFAQQIPREGEPATERTEFKILYDDHNLYIYAMMYDSSPDSIVARLARRDDTPESDDFYIGFDSYNDKQTSFIFGVLPSGTKIDFLNYNDGQDEDYSWDPVWEASTKILSNGWSVEMKIPLSQLRFTEGNDVWGLDLERKISRRQEETYWQLIRKNVNGLASQFGTLTGMSGVKLPLLVEALPYGVVSSEHDAQTAIREKKEQTRPNAGVDIKYGVSSNFTLDATVNPDFAQVEVDPAVLNLTTFETFYPEKRPFFIEGTQILRFVTFGGTFGPGLFYSRRIGKGITVPLPDDGQIITDEPRSTTILGAMKFSGKTESGTSIGALTAITNEEDFTYRDTLGTLHTTVAEPNAAYNLFRMKQDFWGNSNIGAIVTEVSRDGRNPAFTGGTDWDIKLENSTYRLNGFYAHSHVVTGSGETREGSAGKANIAKASGDWIYNVSYDFTSKKYFINDIGFFNSPNDYGVFGNISYRNIVPGEYFRWYTIGLNPHLRWNYDRLTLFKELRLNLDGQLENFWTLSGSVQYSQGEKDPYDPRGYGAYNYPSSVFARAQIGSDTRKQVIVTVEENYRHYINDGTVNNVAGSMIIRPTTAMEYQITLGYATDRNFSRYADTVTSSAIVFSPGNPVAVYGKRNVDNIDLTLRSSLLFTQNLSLQWYGQFFWAKGEYRDFSILQPNGDLQSYPYTGNVDFNRTSLLSNIVLRWEYREGSTFYFVWSHGRHFYQNGGYGTDIAANVDNTFLVSPDNVYVLKVTYWLSL